MPCCQLHLYMWKYILKERDCNAIHIQITFNRLFLINVPCPVGSSGRGGSFARDYFGKGNIIYPSPVPIPVCIITQKSLRSFNPVGLDTKPVTYFSGSGRTTCFCFRSGFLSGSLNQTSFAF